MPACRLRQAGKHITLSLFSLGTVLLVENDIGDDAEDKSAGNGGKGNLAEGEGKAADTGNQDNGNNEQITVVIQIDLLNHLKTANCDEAVKRDAHAAHDAGGNGSKEGGEGSNECNDDGKHCGADDGGNRGVAGDGHAGDGLTVGGVGSAAE